MFIKNLSIISLVLFWTISAASYSVDFFGDDTPSKISKSLIKKRARSDDDEKLDPIGLDILAHSVDEHLISFQLQGYLEGYLPTPPMPLETPQIDSSNKASEPSPKKAKSILRSSLAKRAKRNGQKRLSFNNEKEILTFNNPLVEDGEGWLKYVYNPKTEAAGKRSLSVQILDDPTQERLKPQHLSLLGYKSLDRTNPDHRRLKLLHFLDSTATKSKQRLKYHEANLVASGNNPYRFWLNKYNQIFQITRVKHTSFQTILEYPIMNYDYENSALEILNCLGQAQYSLKFAMTILSEEIEKAEGIFQRLNEIEFELNEKIDFQDQTYSDLKNKYENYKDQILCYAKQTLNNEKPIGRSQSFLTSGMQKKLKEIAKEEQQDLDTKFLKCTENALSCFWLLSSFQSEEVFHEMASSFFKNIQTLIHLEDFENARGFLKDFESDFFNNIITLHKGVPSVDHDHQNLAPCDECKDVCVDCVELVRRLEEVKVLLGLSE